ncbi:MAG TPA: adenylyltransferase/cytidyltransferase family protein [bacterium]|nr:adenylyltransferase/cytidyltransferase family protein [bacterium]
MRNTSSGEAKIVTEAELQQRLQQERQAGRTIVWTNGVFDILHAGHVTYLERAAALGDVLVVGLNTDASVQLNKGPLRPVVPERERARLLAALACVDYVILYADQSPVELIRRIHPDIYAKGGDYNLETINQPERRLMESLGGRIELLPGVPGLSTTYIIERILKAYAAPES